MKLTVYFTPVGLTPHELGGRPVLVIDVLRATTSMVTALGHGARAIIPADGPAGALDLAANLDRDDVLLAGERGYQTIEGFALGNSPREMTADAVGGRTLIMATSNGTDAVRASAPGSPVMIGAIVNFSAAAARARLAFEEAGELVILCAGHHQRFALEDAYTAGRFAQEILPSPDPAGDELNDGAIAVRELVRRYGDEWGRAVCASSAARVLRELRLEDDVAAATHVDQFDIVPLYVERQVRIAARG